MVDLLIKPTLDSRSTAMCNRNIFNGGISHTVPTGANYCLAFNFSACLMFVMLAKDKG